MRLEGSCHCKSVKFSVEAHEPVPFLQCYCSICRKTGASGGYGINLGADHNTLEVSGREHVRIYNSSPNVDRAFCGNCGSALWVYSPSWPELVHPHASAIDTELPEPPVRTHIFTEPGSRANWVAVQAGPDDKTFEEYPDESLADWHKRMGLTA